MKTDFINCNIEDGIATLELDDPSANTLTYHLLRELESRFLTLETNPDVKAIVLIGKGDKFFSGGVNIGMLLTAGAKHNSHFILYAVEVLDFIETSDKLVVAAINGNITGGGLELALISDYRVAVEGEYNIGFPEVRLGVIPGMGGTQRLSRLIGPQVAMELITQGTFVSPSHAHNIGLLDQIFTTEDFKQQAFSFAANKLKALGQSDYPGFENYTEIAEKNVISGLATTANHAGVGVLTLSEKCNEEHVLSVLIALNDALLELRLDDDVHTVCIDTTATSFNCSTAREICPVLLRYARQVFGRIDGYPRIVVNLSRPPRNQIEMELAMACDYRFVPEQLCDKDSAVSFSVEAPTIERYRNMLDLEDSTSITLEEMLSAGFYKKLESNEPSSWLIDWMSQFAPPMGASQAIGYAKLAISRGHMGPLSSGMLLERHLQEQLFTGDDSQEGMKAYLEKRTPNFIGQ